MLIISIELFLFLLEVDSVLAKNAQALGCPKCGSRLDVSTYGRKPRGLEGPGIDVSHRRFSYCCRKDGCRKRVTPPSVRFLGRKVYVGAVVTLAMSREWLGKTTLRVCRQTLKRWSGFWGAVLSYGSLFWKNVKLALPPALQPMGSPIAILEIFRERHKSAETALLKCLEFFSPLSVWVPSG